MPHKCFMAESKEDRKSVGAMWYDPTKPDVLKALIESHPPAGSDYSNQYKQKWLGKRSPLFVCLPDGQPFCVDWTASGRTDGSGWEVSGEVPNITVYPSINHNSMDRVHGWHGYIRNGMMTDDLEGRTYEGA